MPITIIKKAPQAPAAPIVGDAMKAATSTYNEDYAARLEWWKKTQPPIGAKPKICLFCKHKYLMPCSEAEHTTCGNWLFLQGKKDAHPADTEAD